ncbi:ABC transporter permease [Mycoplasma struthionis]|uniref:ABC transporter permease n=1 Tax=Mycoplasma struthionis TaxID=538220 RepID=A0A3G8LI60_9MOLU|nr:ABC transporter permease [Mycoplasma struthionis]AZG68560.1 ABC transporter permease [Mycoplasma struthionis]
MTKKINAYNSFIFKTVGKKKSSYIIPTILFAISIILAIVIATIKLNSSNNNIVIYGYTFLGLILTVLYASLKSLNVFRDFEQEGIELLIFSKPLSRKTIILGKMISFLNFGLIYSLVALISNLIVFATLKITFNLGILIVLSFVVNLCAYLLFGLITSLIAYKINQKVAITLPLLVFAPLVLGGGFISASSTSTINNAAYYLNTKYQYHNSGNELDVEGFYLNNNKDELNLIANGLNNNSFADDQKKYLNEVIKIAAPSAKEWQIYSWLTLPYQMVDIFNLSNDKIFNSTSESKDQNLNNFIYHNKLENTIYNYKLDTNSSVLKLPVIGLDNQISQKYFVPGLLKNYSTLANEGANSVIYARENADNFDVTFPEDNFVYASPRNLVGKLNWKNVYDALRYKPFNDFSKEFYKKINQQITNEKITSYSELSKLLLDSISAELANPDSQLYKIKEHNIAIFDDFAIKNELLQSETERKIYFAVALLYYLYFNDNNSQLFKSLIKVDTDKNTFAPKQISITVDNNKYFIGGFDSYETKQQVNNNKVVIRYELTPSKNNFLFENVDEIYTIKRDKKIINKYAYIAIWATIIVALALANYFLYTRRDYK